MAPRINSHEPVSISSEAVVGLIGNICEGEVSGAVV